MVVPGKPMSLEVGLEQARRRLGRLRVGRGLLLAAGAVGGAEWPTAEEDRAPG